MGGAASKTLMQIQVASEKAKGRDNPEDEKKLLDEITQRYETQTSPYYAAARLWVDELLTLKKHDIIFHKPLLLLIIILILRNLDRGFSSVKYL
jgi:acetyl-CoA carboxylase carboxyltransferase component